MTARTRWPARPSWPILLLAAADHAVAVDACVQAAASDMVGRTLWIPIGRDDPDTPVEGLEVVAHDGTYRGLLDAVGWATAQQSGEDRPVLLILDTVSALRTMLTDEARATAAERHRAHGWPLTPEGVEVPRELWHDRDQRWHRVINTARRHPGPVLLTAYLDEQPTYTPRGDRLAGTVWEIQADRNLARSVTGVIEWRDRDTVPIVTGAIAGPGVGDDDLTVEDIWQTLGLADPPAHGRTHTETAPRTPGAERAALVAQIGDAALAAGVPREEVAAGWANSHGGQPINHPDADLDELTRTRDALLADAAARQETDA